MGKLIQMLMASGMIFCAPVLAGQWYEPDNAGHGLSWDAIGDQYQAQWYFHDGTSTRWVVTDVCDFGEECPLYTIAAYAFPDHGATAVDAGEIVIDRIGADVLVTYDIHIPEIGCWSLPGQLPPVCRDAWGVSDVSLIYRRGVSEAGMMLLEALVE